MYASSIATLWGVRYVVPDSDLERVNRRIGRSFAITFGVLLVLIRFVDVTVASLAWFISILLAFGWLNERLIARGLSRVRVARSELEPRNVRNYLLVTARAAGVPILVACVVIALPLAVAVTVGLVSTRDWWMLALAIPLYTFMVGMPIWQLVLLSRDNRPT